MGGIAIARGRFQPPQRPVGKQLRINDFIRISPVRLIDENDVQVGVVELNDAKRRAREAALDLVEVSPQSTPPVCKIMDYGKWKYQQKKKEQKARSHSKQSELKEVRLRPKIDEHDLEIKLQRAREFLSEGDKVQFTMLFRGREMMHRDIGMQALNQIKNGLAQVSKVESEPRQMGKRMTMVLSPDRKPKTTGTVGASGSPGVSAAGTAAPAGGANSTASASTSTVGVAGAATTSSSGGIGQAGTKSGI